MTPTSVKRFVAVVTIAWIVAMTILLTASPGFEVDPLRAAIFFGLVGLVAQSLTYQLANSAAGSIAHLPFLSAVLVAPGLSTTLAVACAVLGSELLVKRQPLKALFNVAGAGLACSLASIVFLVLGGRPLPTYSAALAFSAQGAITAWSVGPFIAAFATYFATNSCLVSAVVALSQRQRFVTVWQHNTRSTLVYDAFSLPAVFLFAFIYVRSGAVWALGLAFPLLGLRQLYKANWMLEKVNQELLQLMVAAIEARDPYTSGHSQRVADYSRIVARAAGLGAKATDRVFTAALLHDVGKIHEEFAPILRKPGRLTDSEFAVMKSHSAKGAAIIAKASQLRDLIPAIRGHHEAWDGSGYPDGLRTSDIPIWARVIALADTIDAMTTDRPYRLALSIEAVRDEIRAQAGRQFDPGLAQELASGRHWPAMEAAIGSHGPSRKAKPFASTLHVPRHSAEVGTTVPA
jgi:hypothetical protein